MSSRQEEKRTGTALLEDTGKERGGQKAAGRSG
jgi:hypothetical protein